MRKMRGHCEMLPSMVCERSVESDSGQEVLVRCESSEQKTRWYLPSEPRRGAQGVREKRARACK